MRETKHARAVTCIRINKNKRVTKYRLENYLPCPQKTKIPSCALVVINSSSELLVQQLPFISANSLSENEGLHLFTVPDPSLVGPKIFPTWGTCGSELQCLSSSSCSKSSAWHGRSTHSSDGRGRNSDDDASGVSESRAFRNMPPAVGGWSASTVTDPAFRSPGGDGVDEAVVAGAVVAAGAAPAVSLAGEEEHSSPFDRIITDESARLLPSPFLCLKCVAAQTASCSRL